MDFDCCGQCRGKPSTLRSRAAEGPVRISQGVLRRWLLAGRFYRTVEAWGWMGPEVFSTLKFLTLCMV